jgi:hypothetical protein
MALATLEECFPSWEEIMGSYVAGSIGPGYVPDVKALQRLESYPVTIIVDDLIDFGFHPSIIESLRQYQTVVSNAQVRAWLERGIPDIGPTGCPKGPEGPEGPRGVVSAKGELPWYVEHLMRQQRRQQRMT